MREIDNLACEAANDPQKLTQLITQNERFILNCASRAARHCITKSDDEWSVALFAFAQSVRNYQFDRGSFLSLAELAIRRRLIDYYKTKNRHSCEIPINPGAFDCEQDEDEPDFAFQIQISKKTAYEHDHSIKIEIEAANEVLKQYGFSFYDITDCSPKSRKTKSACAKAAAYILSTPLLLKEMRTLFRLPMKTIEKNTDVPQKILERHRKYIIAAVEILSGGYPYLAEYMRYIKEELDK